MSNQSHAFSIEDAQKHGIPCAILINHFNFWMTKNAANGRNIKDGKVWTYSSVDALAKIFPYWSPDQIRRTLKKMEDKGILEASNFNKQAYDRTKWYSLNAFDVSAYSILRNSEFDLAESPNGFGEIAEPIPDINTDIKTDTETDTDLLVHVDDFFDDLWSAWKPFEMPKGAKAKAAASWKKHVVAAKVNQIEVVEQAKAYCAQQLRYQNKTQHVSTWLNQAGWKEDYAAPMSGADKAMAALDEKYRRESENEGDKAGHNGIDNQTAVGFLPPPA